MGNPAVVTKAIESFESWSKPSEFFERASAFPTLDDADRQLLEQVWESACDSNIWISAETLVAGSAVAENNLAQNFPWLSPLACQQLTRAASYQWR